MLFMLKISKEEKNTLEAVLGLKEPKYISTLDLKYIIVEDWSQDIKQKMYYLSKESQNIDDIIYYNMFKVIMGIMGFNFDKNLKIW